MVWVTFGSYLHHKFLVIRHRSKERLVEQVPGDVLHHSGVACEDRFGVHNLPLFGNCADVPQTNSLKRINMHNICKTVQKVTLL